MLYVLIAVLSVFVSEFVGYLTHIAFHWVGFRPHDTHHDLYTPQDYISATYRRAGRHSVIQDLAYSFPALIYCGIVWAIFGFWAAILAAGVVILMAIINQYMHDAFHIEGHWLERYHWFWQLRLAHWVHHVEDRNFGIVSTLQDRIFGTYKPVPEDRASLLVSQWHGTII